MEALEGVMKPVISNSQVAVDLELASEEKG